LDLRDRASERWAWASGGPRCPGGLTLRSLIQEHAEPARLVDVARAYPIFSARRVPGLSPRTNPRGVRVARRWLAPLDAIETWLQAQGPRPDAVEDEGDELDELRAALAKGVRYNRSAAQHWSPLRGPLRSSAAGPALQSNPTAARAPPSHRSVTVHVSALGGAISWCVAYPRGPGEVDGQGSAACCLSRLDSRPLRARRGRRDISAHTRQPSEPD